MKEEEEPPSRFWVIFIMKLAVAALVHLVENIKDKGFLSKAQDEVSSINGRIRKRREVLQEAELNETNKMIL